MRDNILCFLLCFLAVSVFSQNPDSTTNNNPNNSFVLDGVYVKEHIPEIYNYDLSDFYYNSIFCVTYRKSENPKAIITSDNDSKKTGQLSKKLNLKNCVYFDPSKNYKNGDGFLLNGQDVVSKKGHSNIILPYSLRYYIDTTNMSLFPEQIYIKLDSSFTIDKKKYLDPFYFLNHEVSNAEYREFVAWVKDSIARKILASEFPNEFLLPKYDKNGTELPKEKWLLNWNREFNYVFIKGDDPDYTLLLDQMYLSNNQRFYTRKEIDSRKLVYEYSVQIDDAVLIKNIPIYPDTSCWINDFDQSTIDPMTNMYFWHPAYDNYPVVGVDYHQVMAFLHWKTIKHQKILDKNKIPYKINYSLPTAAEWDMVSTAGIKDKQHNIYDENYYHLGDNSWVTDLSLNNNTINNWSDQLTCLINNNSSYKGKYIIDGGFFTQKVIPGKKDENSIFSELNTDINGIHYMGGNVSEWLQETYSSNWNPIYRKRHQYLNTLKDEDVQLLLQVEQYYNKKNVTNGRLVMGANWYDERYSNKFGINTAGINTKLFVDPSSAHSTLGFRYVVRVKGK